ncbi:hypothetical protein SANTM175S_07630 [Streptomyces antimycoticus]
MPEGLSGPWIRLRMGRGELGRCIGGESGRFTRSESGRFTRSESGRFTRSELGRFIRSELGRFIRAEPGRQRPGAPQTGNQRLRSSSIRRSSPSNARIWSSSALSRFSAEPGSGAKG